MEQKEVTLEQRRLNVTLYGNLEKVSNTLSKCRVRIFYKGMNRNRTYISEEFAQKLIDSLPYCPVKGIFDTQDVDFTDHGDNSAQGKIYAIVPEWPNFAWEDHTDSDGVTRTYACADVLLYTALYPEAKLIPNSSQSMEIYDKTCVGEWKISENDGLPYFYFEDGCLLGLQVLGARTEPCFEGAVFFSLFQDMKQFMEQLKNSIAPENTKKEEEELMDKNLFFRLSDNEKADLIWSALNPNFNEEGNWQVDYYLLDVYEDYALVANSEGYARVSYTKSENDSITIGEITKVYIVDVTESEKLALDAMKAANNTYEATNTLLNENNETIANLTNELEEAKNSLAAAQTDAETKATEYETAMAEKNAEIEAANNALNEANEKYTALESEKVGLENDKNDLNNEVENLREFKKSVETAQKKEILSSMAEHLTEELNNSFNADIDKYSVNDFKKEVYAAAVMNNSNLFAKKNTEPELFFKGKVEEKFETPAEKLLSQHKNRNGGNR